MVVAESEQFGAIILYSFRRECRVCYSQGVELSLRTCPPPLLRLESLLVLAKRHHKIVQLQSNKKPEKFLDKDGVQKTL